jgi:hypothetical protein
VCARHKVGPGQYEFTCREKATDVNGNAGVRAHGQWFDYSSAIIRNPACPTA